MPARKRLTMRQLRTLLRLKHSGARMSDRTIACQIGVARSTLQEYLARIEAAGLSWPLPEDLTDEALECLLFPRVGCRPGFRRRTACCTEIRKTDKVIFCADAHAPRTEFGRSRSSIRLRTSTAMAISVAWASAVWKRSIGPMTCLKRPIWPSTKALGL